MPFDCLSGATRLSRLVVIAGAAAVLAAPSASAVTASKAIRQVTDRDTIASQSNWPQFRYERGHTGFNTAETILGTGNVARLKRAWAATAPGMVDSSPAVANGIVYVGTDGHRVVAYKATSGKLLWKVVTGGEVLSSPTVAGGVVYVGSADGHLYALKARTGQRLWRFTAGPVYSSPALASGVLYVTGATTSGIPVTYAVTAATGHMLWSSPRHGDLTSSPAVANGMVYAETNFGGGGTLWALSAATGKKVWSLSLGPPEGGSCPIDPSPTVANGVVYISGGQDGAAAVNATTGKELWGGSPVNNLVCSSPAVANGVVYTDSGPAVAALNVSTGKLLWFRRNASGNPSPAVANGVLYLATDTGVV